MASINIMAMTHHIRGEIIHESMIEPTLLQVTIPNHDAVIPAHMSHHIMEWVAETGALHAVAIFTQSAAQSRVESMILRNT